MAGSLNCFPSDRGCQLRGVPCKGAQLALECRACAGNCSGIISWRAFGDISDKVPGPIGARHMEINEIVPIPIGVKIPSSKNI